MDSSLGFKVISSGRADANMEDERASDGASTGFEIQGACEYNSSKEIAYFSHKVISYHTAPDLTRTPSTISVDTASFHTADGLESDYPREQVLNV